jgi:hypothetical protein
MEERADDQRDRAPARGVQTKDQDPDRPVLASWCETEAEKLDLKSNIQVL